MKCQKSGIFERFENSQFSKKAQGTNAAILVAIIAILIIMYILFLPQDERDKLLDEADEFDGESSEDKDKVILLDEDIGRLSETDEIDDRELPDVYLFEETGSEELTTLNPVYVKNNVFGEKTKVDYFTLDNLENTDDIIMTFSAPIRKGVLTIKLNDNVIYDYKLNNLNVNPIGIKKDHLQKQNSIEFSTSPVGAKFWATNEYSLEKIKIVGDITDKSRQTSRNIFTLTETEFDNLDTATLKFIPYCSNAAEVGILDVSVNNRNIFSALPLCDDHYKQEVPKSVLQEDENRVVFSTDKGSYSIENVRVELESKDTPETVFWFEINESLYEELREDKREVTLTMNFIDDDKSKKADIEINDHRVRLDQDEDEFTKNLNPESGINYLEEGNNYIKIMPKSTLNIIDVTVVIEEED